MTLASREAFRDRIHEQDVVYFVGEESGYDKPDGNLAVLKGTVTDAETSRRYPIVTLWQSRDQDPKGLGLGITKSPRELFTVSEVSDALRLTDLPLGSGELPIDQLLDDPTIHKEAIINLASISMARLVDDEARRPGDPEY